MKEVLHAMTFICALVSVGCGSGELSRDQALTLLSRDANLDAEETVSVEIPTRGCTIHGQGVGLDGNVVRLAHFGFIDIAKKQYDVTDLARRLPVSRMFPSSNDYVFPEGCERAV